MQLARLFVRHAQQVTIVLLTLLLLLFVPQEAFAQQVVQQLTAVNKVIIVLQAVLLN